MSTALSPLPQKTSLNTHRPMSRLADITANLTDLWELGRILIESRMIPASIDTPAKAVAIILKGDEIGIPPMLALEKINVIQGKPTISPELMMALIERSGQLESLIPLETADACEFLVTRTGRPQITVSFTWAEAVAMGLAGKDNWKKQFGVMMYWRCTTKMGRRVFPDIIAGLYSHEEMDPDLKVDETGEIIVPTAIEDLRPSGQPKPENKGLFGKEHAVKVQEFLAWVNAQCSKINGKWGEEWDARVEKWLADGLSAPEKTPELINAYKFKGHLLKWAKATNRLDGAVEIESARSREAEAYLAAIFHEEKQAIKDEMTEYLKAQRTEVMKPIYKKFPELAPDQYEDDEDGDEPDTMGITGGTPDDEGKDAQ